MAYLPQRGDVVMISFNPQAGHEQEGRRPAVILSPAEYHSKAGLALLCPVTSRIKGYPFEVLIPDGLAVSGAILSDQVKSLDWKIRRAVKLCALPEATISEVLAKLSLLL
jgi:mRNA interferase MazF